MTANRLRVEVADMGLDACLYSPPGETPVLYVRPGQTFESAVRAVQAALGHADDEVATRLVKKYLPDVQPLEELLADPEPSHPWKIAKDAVSMKVLVVILLLLLLAWALLAVDRRYELHGEPAHTTGEAHQMACLSSCGL